MFMKKILKLFGILLLIAAVDIAIFSPTLMGIKIGAAVLDTALGFTAIIMSVVVAAVASSSLLFKQNKVNLLQDVKDENLENYLPALDMRREERIFNPFIDRATAQVKNMIDKENTLDLLLNNYFGRSITAKTFKDTVDNIKGLFLYNIKHIINRMIIFDEKAYNEARSKLMNNNCSNVDVIKQQMEIYNQHLVNIDQMLDCNDEIILKMEALLLEISKLDTFDDKNMRTLGAIEEMNELIKNTKLYNQ